MKPRRGLPADSEPFDSEETDLELSAIRRGFNFDEGDEPVAPRRASRAAPEDDAVADDDAVAEIDLAPSRPTPDEPKTTEAAQPDPEPAPVPPKAEPRLGLAARLKQQGKGAGGASKVTPPAQRRWQIIVAGAALLGIAASLGIGAIPAEQAPLPDTVPLVTAISRTCPVTATAPSTLWAVSTEGDIRTRQVGQSEVDEAPGPLRLADQTVSAVVTPIEPQATVSGGNLVYSGEQAWWGLCRASLADQYVQLPGGAGARLVISNPEQDDALVDVTLSGPEGEITGDGLRGITVPGNSEHVIDLAPFGESVNALGARVRSSPGRVMAYGEVNRANGGDFATSTQQGTVLTIAAVPGGADRTELILTNPGTSRNVVKIEAFGEAGRYDLPGFESYALDAQRTTSIDLTEAIAGAAVGLIITGRDPFAATSVITMGNDFGIEPGQVDEQSVLRQDLLGVVPGAGAVQISNPGNGEAVVVVDWGAGQAPANRTIPAGSVAAIEVPVGAEQVRVTATAPVAAALFLRGAEQPGVAIVLLHSVARTQASMPMEADRGLGR